MKNAQTSANDCQRPKLLVQTTSTSLSLSAPLHLVTAPSSEGEIVKVVSVAWFAVTMPNSKGAVVAGAERGSPQSRRAQGGERRVVGSLWRAGGVDEDWGRGSYGLW